MCYKRKNREFMNAIAARHDEIKAEMEYHPRTKQRAAEELRLQAIADAFDRIYLLGKLSIDASLTASSLTRDPSTANDRRRKKAPKTDLGDFS